MCFELPGRWQRLNAGSPYSTWTHSYLARLNVSNQSCQPTAVYAGLPGLQVQIAPRVVGFLGFREQRSAFYLSEVFVWCRQHRPRWSSIQGRNCLQDNIAAMKLARGTRREREFTSRIKVHLAKLESNFHWGFQRKLRI